MAPLFVLLSVTPLTLASCGSDDDTGPSWGPDGNEQAIAQIQACSARGGTPIFTTNSYGDVATFLSCTEKETP